MPATLDRLEKAIEDETVRPRFIVLLSVTQAKRDGLSATVALTQAENPPSLEQIEDAFVANKLALDSVRVEIDNIQRLEGVVLDRRRALVDDVRTRFLTLTAVSAIIGLLGSFAAVYLFSTGIVRRVSKLEGDAELLARVERLETPPEEADELGRLAQRLGRASELLRMREDDLRASEERFRLVIEQVGDYGIFALDPDGIVTSWNLGAERIKGWRTEEIVGQHFSRFYPTETREFLPDEMLERARVEGTAEDEGLRLRKDGTQFWANVVITALHDEAGELQGFAKVTRDMTERRRSEEDLRLAREEAVAANLAKSEFLSRTSHELRTPLNAILGIGQLLEIDEQDFAKAGRHLLSLINDLLNISSIEAGAEGIETEAFQIADLLEDIRDLANPIVNAAGLRFEIDLPSQEASAQADKRRTTQVILNLVSNAAKYNVEGSFVRLGAQSEDDGVLIFVEDDGPGVDLANRARLFTAFDRLGQQQQSHSEGTGLGLALSKSLVESMGGELDYTPLEPGARFWFTLPRNASVEDARQAAE